MTSTIQNMLPIDLGSPEEKSGFSFERKKDILKGAPLSTSDTFLPDLPSDGLVRGIVSKVNFSNPENGFHILKVRLIGVNDVIAFVGPCEPVAVGDKVEAKGRWEVHARHGRQLKASFVRVLTPSTGAEIHAFLKAGGVKGLGKVSADKLFAFHGDNLAKIMDRPTLLMGAGITEKQALLLSDSWQRRSTNTEVMAFLSSLSIGPAMIDKVLKAYGGRAKQKLVANPYQAIRDISGLGFKIADKMASALNIVRDDPRRLQAAVIHVFQSQAREGHCAASRAKIMKEVRKLLLVEDEPIRGAIKYLLEEKLLIEEPNGGQPLMFESSVLKCEEEIASRIVAMRAKFDMPANIDEMITQHANAIGITSLHEHQALAVKTALAAGVSVITGGPGAGKTASLEVLLRVFEQLVPEATISLCAPTGRAAQRMTETTGRPALTIHRLLEWGQRGEGFQVNEENPLETDIVVIDEASMLDIWLMRDVLRAIPKNGMLVLIGDVDQLPSVGPGRVLGDIIDSGSVPVARLTRIFRQGEGSYIAAAARTINSSRMPVLKPPSKKSDLWGVFSEDADVCLQKVVKMVTEVGPNLGYDAKKDIQVLVAGHGGTLGTVMLNRAIQDVVNPVNTARVHIDLPDIRLRVGDRVIQTANNYDLDVFNGDIGQVIDIELGRGRKESMRVRVQYDEKEIVYEGIGPLRDLSLAYAITVHKSQGSEFPFVIFVASTQHYIMLKKTLVYTAVTRARKLCAIVGQERALGIAVRQTDNGRLTGLARRLAISSAEAERRYGEY
jgi:exodeoxyribonuclease V alpha subunit